jgi:Carbohydrate-selective porin, OprB family
LTRSFVQFDGEGDTANARARAIGGHAAETLKNVCLRKDSHNGISKVHEEFLNDGGLGILVDDGMLPHPGPERIIETYYSYALSASTHLTADYQFIANPGYSEDRGPVSVFSARMHWQF